jgi:hypothetical protein
VLDLRRLGPFLHARAALMASPTVSARLRLVPPSAGASSLAWPSLAGATAIFFFLGFFLVIRILGVSPGFRAFSLFGLLCGFWAFSWA